MKKSIILLLLLAISCGPSEAEIQTRVDNAVKEALTSTTTSIPSTTTNTEPALSEYDKCRNDVQALLKIYTTGYWGKGEYTRLPGAYNNFYRALGSSFYNFDDIEVERAWIDWTNSLEEVLTAKSNLPKPDNRTTYQEYYFAFENLINTWVDWYELWSRVEAGYPNNEFWEKSSFYFDRIQTLEPEIYQITYCSE